MSTETTAPPSALLNRLQVSHERHAAKFKRSVEELLLALDLTSGGLSTDRSHWERQRRAEAAVRKALKNV
jgi:hypothetical protein